MYFLQIRIWKHWTLRFGKFQALESLTANQDILSKWVKLGFFADYRMIFQNPPLLYIFLLPFSAPPIFLIS